ncbi:MAG: DUF2798 domain-containing protein [Paracoccaceae bacterium]
MSPRFAPLLFGLILSGMMSLIVAGVSTARNVGHAEGFAMIWFSSWLASWLIAFPTVLILAPLTRRLVRVLVRPTRAEVGQ